MSGQSRDAYDAWHDVREVIDESESPWHRLVRQYLDRERDLAGRKVLEIGCGRGSFACWLAEASSPRPSVTAADFSETAIRKGAAFAEERGISNVDWRLADIQNLEFADRTFDTIISCETIEHVPDPALAVRELSRVLRPGGRLFLSTPNYLGIMGLYRGYLRLVGRRFTEVGQPINNFTMTPRTISWLRRAKLQVDVVEGRGHYLTLPGGLVETPSLERLHPVSKWIAHHSMIIARKR